MRSEVPIEPICGTEGTTATLQHGELRLDDDGTGPGPALGQGRGTDEERCAHDLLGEARAGPRGPGLQHGNAEGVAVFGRDGTRGAVAETSGQPS